MKNNNNHRHHNNKNISSNHYNNNHHQGSGGSGGSGSSEIARDGVLGGSSSGSDTITAVCPPKFVIALTNKEKEEDFMAIKGSKLPQRPKKRAKFIQRTLNVRSPTPHPLFLLIIKGFTIYLFIHIFFQFAFYYCGFPLIIT